MALTNAYCTLEELRDHFGDDGARLPVDALERAINASSRAIDRFCGQRFWQDASTVSREFVAPSSSCVLLLTGRGAAGISTRTGLVVQMGSDGTTFPTTLVDGTDFILEPRNADALASGDEDPYSFNEIVALGSYGFTTDPYRPTIRVTARWGWSAVPDDVTQACILKAASLFKRKDAPFGVAGFGEFGAVRIGRNDPDVIDLLAGYEIVGYA